MFYHLTDSTEDRTEVRPYACMYGFSGKRTWGSSPDGVKELHVGALFFALDTEDRFFVASPDFILTHKNYYIYIFGLLFGECCIYRKLK